MKGRANRNIMIHIKQNRQKNSERQRQEDIPHPQSPKIDQPPPPRGRMKRRTGRKTLQRGAHEFAAEMRKSREKHDGEDRPVVCDDHSDGVSKQARAADGLQTHADDEDE